VYSIFFTCVAGTLKDFGLNPKNLGAEIGMTMAQRLAHLCEKTLRNSIF